MKLKIICVIVFLVLTCSGAHAGMVKNQQWEMAANEFNAHAIMALQIATIQWQQGNYEGFDTAIDAALRNAEDADYCLQRIIWIIPVSTVGEDIAVRLKGLSADTIEMLNEIQ